MKPLTIIYVHKEIGNGNAPQLDAALEAARIYSPTSRLVCITDEPGRYAHLCETFCIHEYWDLADSYAPVYKHESQLSPAFERTAIQRWLVIAQWVNKHGGEVAGAERGKVAGGRYFCADSDVLIFSDLERERLRWEQCDFTLSSDPKHPGLRQAGSIFVSGEVLWALALYLFKRDGHGGNDMALWSAFAASRPDLKRGETTEIIDGATGDHHLQYFLWQFEGDGIVKKNGMESKKLWWRMGQPYAELKSKVQGSKVQGQDGMVRLLWLHCWGRHKQLMNFHLECGVDCHGATEFVYRACPV